MDDIFDKEVRPLLDLIDSLRQLGVSQSFQDGYTDSRPMISLPQIVVMGDQSSGKSSVLQSICGIPFPRGTGLVTRCPTQLIMSKAAPGSEWSAEISIDRERTYDSTSSSTTSAFDSLFSDKSDKQPPLPTMGSVSSVEELCQRIEELTQYLTGGTANSFSTDSIVIRLTSVDSPDLTIIDLPGIVRTATKGQDRGVVSQVNGLIEKYIAMPNTIILAVVPCNQDIATVDILERASTVDPLGLRTIAVLTKPDLVNPGAEEEIVEILQNKKKPLKLGYIMVKNMSQKQLNDKCSVLEARTEEAKFFADHPVYAPLVGSGRLGIVNLTESLTKLLVWCIKQTLPTMMQDIKRLRLQAKSDELALGKDIPEDMTERQSLLAKKVTSYCQLLRHTTRGEYRDPAGVLAANEIMRLHSRVQQSYKKLQDNVANLRPSLAGNNMADMLGRLELDMTSQRGRELPGFINTQVFYAYIVDLVEELRPMIEDCRSEVVRDTLYVSSLISSKVIEDFPELCAAVKDITDTLIEATGSAVSAKLDSIVLREQDPFTTQDVLLEVVNGIRFRTFENVLRQIIDTTNTAATGSNENALKEDLKNRIGSWYMMRHGVDVHGNQQEMLTLIQAYWDIASRRLTDNVCMCLEMEFCSKLVVELEAQCILYGISVDEAKTEELLQESASVGRRRMFLKEKVQMLESAMAELEKVTLHLE